MPSSKKYFFFFALLAFTKCLMAQAPVIVWEKCIGGSDEDYVYSIVATADGGCVAAGSTTSSDGDLAFHKNNIDIWVFKLDAQGTIVWNKTFGGSGVDQANAILATRDGGFVLTGYSNSNDGDIINNNGGNDVVVLKLDSAGNLQWEKSLGGSLDDFGQSIIATSDGNYIIAGITNSLDGDVTHNNGKSDYWIVKLDSTGKKILWQKNFGGTDFDRAMSVTATHDNSCVVAGATYSDDFDITFNNGGADYWIIKLDSNGTLAWRRSLGGSQDDIAQSIITTADGGTLVAGYSKSTDGDLAGTTAGGYNYWMVKLDDADDPQWNTPLGGASDDLAKCVAPTPDGGSVIVGYSNSTGGTFSGNHGGNDFWLVKLDKLGTPQWNSLYGGSQDDDAFAVAPSGANEFFIGGSTTSGQTFAPDGDVSHSHGKTDAWIVKLGNSNAKISSVDSLHIFSSGCNDAQLDTLMLLNTGSTVLEVNSKNISGADAALFTLFNAITFPLSIQPGDSVRIIIKFLSATGGTKQATLSFTSNDSLPGHNPWRIALSGTVVAPDIILGTSLLNLGATTPGVTICGSLQVSASENVADTIIGIILDSGSSAFSFVSPPLPIIVQAGTSSVITMCYTPVSTASQQAIFAVHTSPCDNVHRFTVTGNNSSCAAVATLALPDVSANVGAHVSIPISIVASHDLTDCGATQFTLGLRFNRSILFPLDAAAKILYSGRDAILTISGTRTDTIGNLLTLHFVAALGDTAASPLHVESFTWLNGATASTISDGTFQLANVCTQGGARLVSDRASGTLMLAQNVPNPFSDATTIEFNLIEKGHTRLTINDMLGRTVAVLCDDYFSPGYYSQTFQSSTITNGVYACTLQTPTATITKMMAVKK